MLVGILGWRCVRLIIWLASIRLPAIRLRNLLVVGLLIVLRLIRLLVGLLIWVWLAIRIELAILTLSHSQLRGLRVIGIGGLRVYILIGSLRLIV